MTQHYLPPHDHRGPVPDDNLERAGRAVTLPLVVMAGAILGVVGLFAGLFQHLQQQPQRAAAPTVTFVEPHSAAVRPLDFTPALTSITPITSLTASAPVSLGGTTPALCASADFIDIAARTSASTDTLSLVYYNTSDSSPRWYTVGPTCAITTAGQRCRYVAQRGNFCWFVYAASGASIGWAGIEQTSRGSGDFGSIEPPSSPGGVTSITCGSGLTCTASNPITTSGTVALTSTSTTVNGQTCSLGGSCTVSFTPVVTKITSGSGNWTPTAGATIVRVICVGGGGGGGSGRQGTSGSSWGGGGGGGGGYNERTMPVADLSVPVAYSVGAGGPGGAAQASGATSGNAGTSGGATTFGSYCRGGGGIAGSGGTGAVGTPGAGGQGLFGGTGYGGAGSNTTGANAEASNPYVSSWSITTPGAGATGGGGGGGGNSATPGIGGNGGTRVSQGGTAAAGGASTGLPGAPGTGAMLPFGYGGGGGAGGTAGTAGGDGGDGATYGGGGGGGGGSVTGAASGAGGDGASGTIWIFESHLLPANDNATRMVA